MMPPSVAQRTATEKIPQNGPVKRPQWQRPAGASASGTAGRAMTAGGNALHQGRALSIPTRRGVNAQPINVSGLSPSAAAGEPRERRIPTLRAGGKGARSGDRPRGAAPHSARGRKGSACIACQAVATGTPVVPRQHREVAARSSLYQSIPTVRGGKGSAPENVRSIPATAGGPPDPTTIGHHRPLASFRSLGSHHPATSGGRRSIIP